MRKTSSGFTIVELLIVVVVIAILATISIVAYNGVQARARDTERKSDVSQITEALELYYADNGQYPAGSCASSCAINSAWSTTADDSWANFVTIMKPYMGNVPSDDPINTQGVAVWSNANNYSYAYASVSAPYCGTTSSTRQVYILVYRLEGSAQTNTLTGDCPSNPLGLYSASNYRVVK